MTNNFEEPTPLPGYLATEPPALRALPALSRESELRAGPSPALPDALSAVARGYAAAHGHPLEHDGLLGAQKVRRRWALGLRAALIIIILLCLFGVYLAVQTLGTNNAIALSAPDAQDAHVTRPESGVLDAENLTSVPLIADQPDPPDPKPQAAPEVAADVVVHVAGQVHVPGVVRLSSGARAADAIAAAGGLTPEANPNAINLAQVLVDSEQIYVPAIGEEVVATIGANAGADKNDADSLDAAGLVNINTADSVLLQTLPGIGPALAERILTWRETNGRFLTKEDLLSVSGIGPAVMGNLQALVTVG